MPNCPPELDRLLAIARRVPLTWINDAKGPPDNPFLDASNQVLHPYWVKLQRAIDVTNPVAVEVADELERLCALAENWPLDLQRKAGLAWRYLVPTWSMVRHKVPYMRRYRSTVRGSSQVAPFLGWIKSLEAMPNELAIEPVKIRPPDLVDLNVAVGLYETSPTTIKRAIYAGRLISYPLRMKGKNWVSKSDLDSLYRRRQK